MSTIFRLALVSIVALTVSTVSAQRNVDLDAITISDVNAAFAAGTLTSERLVQLFLGRIQAYDRQGPALR